MSLKAELETWVKALGYFDAQDYPQALLHFAKIADSSRILFNVGLIHATRGDHEAAIAYYKQAQALDPYFAISFFQCGIAYFLLEDYLRAAEHFQDAYHHLRENTYIDYDQIGLKFKLYSAEILYNQGLAYIRLHQIDQGMRLLDQARKEKQAPEHEAIEDAFAKYGNGFTVFSVPTGILFRPSERKVKNLKAKNYLGTAKLVAATSPVDAFVGFSGIGAKSSSLPGSDLTDSPTDMNRQSPPTSAKSAPARVPAPISNSKQPEPSVQPLTITRKKSSVDLREAARTPRPAPPMPAGSSSIKLPRINTDVYRPSIAQHTPVSYSLPPLRQVPTVGAPMPPTPPDSEPGRHYESYDRRTTTSTVLGYLNEPEKRDTALLEDLVEDYGAMQILPPERRPSLPISFDSPQPRGQSIDRVAKWADSQLDARGADFSGRYKNPSAPTSHVPSTVPSRQGTMRRLPTHRSKGSNGFQSLRRGALDEYLSPTLTSRDSIDDLLNGRSAEMVSFRLKLHFEDDVRGMSLDVDTPYPEFYARLQSKFGLSDMSLKYKDEDGTFITIADDDDWNSAVDAARENCQAGRHDGKLDIWVVEGRSR